jgi:hypothetical protein
LRRLLNRQKSCTICSKAFQNMEETTLGFNVTGEEVCTCQSCRNHVKEFVTDNAFQVNKIYGEPAPTDTLWRYLDFAKFISLLDESALYFCRADNFLNDPFEGAAGIKAMKSFWDQKEREHIVGLLKLAKQQGYLIDEATISEQADRAVADLRNTAEKYKHCKTFITCWHLNPIESDAMWQIYSRRNEYMVAIKTTVERLDKALGDHSDNEIGKVNYIDYKNFYDSTARAFWYKRQSFAHEREVRAIIEIWDKIEAKGILEPVQLDMLVERVVIGPKSPHWFEGLVKSVTLKYNQKFEIHRSEMDAEPFF